MFHIRNNNEKKHDFCSEALCWRCFCWLDFISCVFVWSALAVQYIFPFVNDSFEFYAVHEQAIFRLMCYQFITTYHLIVYSSNNSNAYKIFVFLHLSKWCLLIFLRFFFSFFSSVFGIRAHTFNHGCIFNCRAKQRNDRAFFGGQRCFVRTA